MREAVKTRPLHSSLPCRKAGSPEASLVRGGARGGRGAPDPKHHRAPGPRQGRLRALPAAVPAAGQQPPRLASHQVLLPQPHPAAEEKPAARQRPLAPHCLLKRGSVRGREGKLEGGDVWCGAADQSRFSNGTLLPRKCTNFERTV